MPRRLPVGQGTAWSLDVPANTLTWFTPDCRLDATRSGAFPYRQRAWLERQIDAGGDVGVRDAVVLEYAPYDPVSGRSNPERFYFARGAGWFMWQRQGVESRFVRRSPFVVTLNRDVWCGNGATQ
jgi:hypothetical protein